MSLGLIIVVDDNPTFRKMYSDFLSLHGYTVMTASGGEEGMKLLLNCTPMVLILDISMPVMDGIETCRNIRRIHGNDIPIVFLTAFNDVDKLRDCLHAGGDDYLIKSGNLDNVLGRVKFWSAAANRQEARTRRDDVIQEVDETIERIDHEVNEAESAAAFIEELSCMRWIPLRPSPMAPASRAKTTATTSLAMPPALSAIGPILKQPSNLDI